jgi:hypothetical protein
VGDTNGGNKAGGVAGDSVGAPEWAGVKGNGNREAGGISGEAGFWVDVTGLANGGNSAGGVSGVPGKLISAGGVLGDDVKI